MERQDKSSLQQAGSKNALRAWLYLMKCAKHIEQEMSDRFRENYKSSFSRFDVMAHLHHAGNEGISTTNLASRLLASKGNITRLLDRMETDGLISRTPGSKDRRVSTVYLSQTGAELFARMASDHESWSQEMFAAFSEKKMNELIQLLKTVKGHLDTQR